MRSIPTRTEFLLIEQVLCKNGQVDMTTTEMETRLHGRKAYGRSAQTEKHGRERNSRWKLIQRIIRHRCTIPHTIQVISLAAVVIVVGSGRTTSRERDSPEVINEIALHRIQFELMQIYSTFTEYQTHEVLLQSINLYATTQL